MRQSVLILGEAPGRNTDPGAPLATGQSGRRIERLAGILIVNSTRRNLLPEWPGQDGNGCLFPALEARRAARFLLAREGLGYLRIVALGVRVWAAIGLKPDCPWFTQRSVRVGWTGRHHVFAKLFPHPSGVSHFWNCRRRVEVARWELKESLS